MKALVILGHPATDSFNQALATAILGTWQTAGIATDFHDLTAEGFNPCLTPSEARGNPTQDPLVQAHIAQLTACDLLAIIHPNCWGAPPAIMKGWIDRVFAPNAAYSFAKGEDQGDVPVGLLRVRAALVINTGNTASHREIATFGDPLDRIWRDCVLGYVGISDITRKLFGVVSTSTPDMRQDWIRQTETHARQIAQRALVSR